MPSRPPEQVRGAAMTPDDLRLDDRTRSELDEATASYRRALKALPPGGPEAAAAYQWHLARVREIFHGPASDAAPQPTSAAPVPSPARIAAHGNAADRTARAARPWH